MIWLQGWTVTTRGKGNSQCANAPIYHLFFTFFLSFRILVGDPAGSAPSEVKVKVKEPPSVPLSPASFFFCLPLNCGSLGEKSGGTGEEREGDGGGGGREGRHWSARWLINWEAQRPLTPMMQGDRANGARRLARSFSGWTCHQWCSRVEKGSAEQKNAARCFFFLSFFLSLCIFIPRSILLVFIYSPPSLCFPSSCY